MGKVNPIVLIQLMMQYHNYSVGQRVFKFSKHDLMRIHRETDEEMAKRKSILKEDVKTLAETTIRNKLAESLKGRAGNVYIDPAMKSIAVPLNMSTSKNGYGVLSTGSRIKIPAGKKIRAFTYWEKVNDIDISCFALKEDGVQIEFSWRTMAYNQSEAITFSGDEASGYNGGSEYFDIVLDKFIEEHPMFRYIVFCDNIYTSGYKFDDCFCKAGFMMRDEQDSGEIFEPKTVKTSFSITGNATFNYLFAIDLKTREMIWLNIARDKHLSVAGEEKMDSLLGYFTMTDVFNVYDLFNWAGTKTSIHDADIIISDYNFDNGKIDVEGKEIIRSYDFEKIMKYLS